MANQGHKKAGFQKKEPKEFEEDVIQIDRVTKVVKGGRTLRFRATVAIGDKKGRVGIGVGKSHEVTGAIQKAIAKAKKSLITVVIDGTTVPHDLKIKHKSSRILLMPAAEGTGIIAGGSIRKVLILAGYKDILSKSYGTTNKLNNTKGTFEALQQMRETPMMAKRKAKAAATSAAKKAEAEKKAAEKNPETPTPEKTPAPATKKPVAKAPAKAPEKTSAKPAPKKSTK